MAKRFYRDRTISIPEICKTLHISITPTPSRKRKYSRIADTFLALATPESPFLASAARYSRTSTLPTSEASVIATLLSWRNVINCRTSVRYARRVAALRFFPSIASKKAARPFSSVMVAPCVSVLFVIPPLLSHTGQIRTREPSRKKLIPITYSFLYYMEPLCYVSRGKTGGRGTGKRDYRNR